MPREEEMGISGGGRVVNLNHNVAVWVVRGNYGGDGGAGWHVRVDEVGASTRATHRAGSSVIGQGSLLSSVEGAEPVSLFGGWVSNLSRISSPWPPPNS